MPGTGCVAASGVSSAVNEVITSDVGARMERTRRALTVTRVARRTGLRRVLAEIGVVGHREATREAAHGFRQALEELGTTYIKLGQLLSSRPDLLRADGTRRALRSTIDPTRPPPGCPVTTTRPWAPDT